MQSSVERVHILVGDLGADWDYLTGAATGGGSVSWIVPKTSQVGERVFFYFGAEGIIAEGRIADAPSAKMAKAWKKAPGYYGAHVDNLRRLQAYVYMDRLRQRMPTWKWPNYPRSYVTVPPEHTTKLLKVIEEEQVLDATVALPQEVPAELRYVEGESQTIHVNTHERSPQARAACVRIQGTRCKVCGLRYDERYGDIGKGYIEVHHLVPVSMGGTRRKLDPATDLVVVCSNCHVMLHKQRPPLTVQELKLRLRPPRMKR